MIVVNATFVGLSYFIRNVSGQLLWSGKQIGSSYPHIYPAWTIVNRSHAHIGTSTFQLQRLQKLAIDKITTFDSLIAPRGSVANGPVIVRIARLTP